MKSFRKKNLAFSTSPGASNANLQALCQNNPFSIARCYLFVYNLFMFCGFLYALIVMSLKYSADQEGFPAECWKTVGNIFKFLHLLMYLEVLPTFFETQITGVFEMLTYSFLLGAKPPVRIHKGFCGGSSPPGLQNSTYFCSWPFLGDWKKHLDICADRQ